MKNLSERLAKLRLQREYLRATCHCRWGKQNNYINNIENKNHSCQSPLWFATGTLMKKPHPENSENLLQLRN